MKPETNARKKVAALERRAAMLDALIDFLKAHPEITSDAVLHSLAGKTGLNFPDYALIVPNWKGGKAVLRLVKSGDDWITGWTPMPTTRWSVRSHRMCPACRTRSLRSYWTERTGKQIPTRKKTSDGYTQPP
jgi:hypothetical protein